MAERLMHEKLLKLLRAEKLLHELAGVKSYERGHGYYEQGAVRSLVTHAGKLAACVEGTEDYTVVLWPDGAGLHFRCSCPVGEREEFCKHCVAVALTFVEVVSAPSGEDEDDWDEYFNDEFRGSRPKLQTLEDVQSYLESCRKEQLIELLLEVALESDEWRVRLKRKARGGKRRQ